MANTLDDVEELADDDDYVGMPRMTRREPDAERQPPVTVNQALLNPQLASRSKKASPTEDEMKHWTKVEDAFAWAGFTQANSDTAESLMQLLRHAPDDPLAEFGTIDSDDFSSDL